MTCYRMPNVKTDAFFLGRLLFLICFLCFFSIVGAAKGQPALSKKLTIVEDDVSITTLISRIENQCGVKVAYGEIVRNNHIKIDLRIRSVKLKTVLDETLPRYRLSYTFVKNMLVLKQEQDKKVEDTGTVLHSLPQVDTLPEHRFSCMESTPKIRSWMMG